MILPIDLQEKINSLYSSINKQILTDSRIGLTSRYKQTKESGRSLIDSKTDGIVYAISRMPATYSVVHTLLDSLIEQEFICDISNVFDVGSGTGAGYFATKDVLPDVEISLFERDLNMIQTFKQLDETKAVQRFDLVKDEFSSKADLIMTSYVLSEMNEETRMMSVKKMLEASNRYVLLIDTGTPRTYENFMKIKRMINESDGVSIIAPCASEKCGLKNDYCQFFARVERSSLQKMSKDASLSYEDEKYFYLLIEKSDVKHDFCRVIRRPQIKTNLTELKVCDKDGVKDLKITKKSKELYKKSKKVKINELIELDDIGEWLRKDNEFWDT